MSKKNVALVFGITENYVFALANTLIGLKKNNKKFWDDILIYVDKIQDEDKESLNKILPCKIINYEMKDIENSVSKALLAQYSIATFFRFECFNLLNEYKTVIWNDVDILIKGDISKLVDYGKDTGFALTLNTLNLKNEANFNGLLLEYDMFAPLYNAGIMVIHDNLNKYEEMKSWCINKTVELGERLRWGDQAILNILIQEFNIKVDLIDINVYCCHPTHSKYTKAASIIHAYGTDKFWNCQNYKELYPEWLEYNEEWEQISKKHTLLDGPLVSCVMSTYNRYDCLNESVDSILNQTYKNIELIIVLEKSENQNKIESILKKYKDKRIKIIKNEKRLGFAASLNIGIEESKGKYIARMDDDDISLPERFAKQVDFMEKHPEIGISGTAAQTFGKYNNKIDVLTDPEELKTISLIRTPFIHPTVIMRKDLLDKYDLRYSTEFFSEDYELWSRAIDKFPISNIDEVLLMYRSGNGNATDGSNEAKIHNSHKKTMYNEFKNYLQLDLNNNELEVLQDRINSISGCYNEKELIQFRNNVVDKIIARNNKVKYYDPAILSKTLKKENVVNVQSNKQSLLKRGVKKLFFPIYKRLMNRVEDRIVEHDCNIYNYVNNQIDDLKKEYKEKKK